MFLISFLSKVFCFFLNSLFSGKFLRNTHSMNIDEISEKKYVVIIL